MEYQLTGSKIQKCTLCCTVYVEMCTPYKHFNIVSSKRFWTFCTICKCYWTSIHSKLWLVEGSLVSRMGAESLPYLVQSTCRTSSHKHVSVIFSDTLKCRVQTNSMCALILFNWEKLPPRLLRCCKKCLLIKVWIVRQPTSGREDSRAFKHRSKMIHIQGSLNFNDNNSIQRVRAVIRSNQWLTLHEAADDCGISVGSIHTILTEKLNMHRIAENFYTAAADWRAVGATCCHQSRTSPSSKWWRKFFKNIVRGDETWVYGYDVETKRQSLRKISKFCPEIQKSVPSLLEH